MDLWNIAEMGAWGISGLLIIWMLVDAIAVGARFDESLLVSSREGMEDVSGELAQKEKQA
jgi:hypothetical protein